MRERSGEVSDGGDVGISFAFIYNAAGIPIAAGVVYPFVGLLLSPIIAAAAMSFSAASVTANALRLRTVAA